MPNTAKKILKEGYERLRRIFEKLLQPKQPSSLTWQPAPVKRPGWPTAK